MRQLLLILSVTLGLTTAAQAEVFPNRDAWVKFDSEEHKMSYLTGVYDVTVRFLNTDSKAARKWKEKVQLCMSDMNANAYTMKEMIDNYYSDVGNWKVGVVQATANVLHEACGKD